MGRGVGAVLQALKMSLPSAVRVEDMDEYEQILKNIDFLRRYDTFYCETLIIILLHSAVRVEDMDEYEHLNRLLPDDVITVPEETIR